MGRGSLGVTFPRVGRRYAERYTALMLTNGSIKQEKRKLFLFVEMRGRRVVVKGENHAAAAKLGGALVQKCDAHVTRTYQ